MILVINGDISDKGDKRWYLDMTKEIGDPYGYSLSGMIYTDHSERPRFTIYAQTEISNSVQAKIQSL